MVGLVSNRPLAYCSHLALEVPPHDASAGAADGAQTEGLGNFNNGQRIDDATGNAAFHDQIAFFRVGGVKQG